MQLLHGKNRSMYIYNHIFANRDYKYASRTTVNITTVLLNITNTSNAVSISSRILISLNILKHVSHRRINVTVVGVSRIRNTYME